MKKLIIAFTLISGTLLAQTGAKATGPSYSDLYCSGFLTRDSVPRTNFVLGSKESPHEDRFPARSTLFLGGGSLVEGQRYTLLRQVQDPNREESSPEQRKKFRKLGALYQEIGWVTVSSLQKNAAVASFDFACEAARPGDIVVPFKEKPAIAFRSTDAGIKTFRDASDALKGHILGSKDFDEILGTGQIVYTDFGSAKGAKPGDYLVVTRGYAPGDLNKIDRASDRLPRGSEPAAINSVKVSTQDDARLPQQVLGELLVLNASADSSTALVTRSLNAMELGDTVQSEDK